MSPSRLYRSFVVIFLKEEMSQLLHVGVWFNPFATKLNKLANVLRTTCMYRLLNSVMFAAGLCPDPLRQLTALYRPPG